MKVKNKRLATILLAAAVGVSFVQTGSVTLYAMENQEGLLSDETAAGSDFQYRELDDGSIEITKYTGSMENVIIPVQIDGKSVTSIGYEAFSYCSGLSSVEIPDSVTSIGEWAFSGCSLSSIEIPSSVTSIGEGAFSACDNLSGIGVDANNTNYASEDGILYNKDKTELIRCPGGKTGAVEILSSVTSIGEEAFSWCGSLSSIEVNANNTDYTSENGILYNKDKTELIRCPEGKTEGIEILSSVTSIGKGAFWDCSGLSSVEIPDSVMSIGKGAFGGCENLSSVEIPGSVTNISDDAFASCTSLNSVEILNGVTSIGEWAFAYCYNLNSVGIPDSVTSIGNYAFYRCNSLSSIEMPSNITSIGYSLFDGCSSLRSIEIPRGVTEIGAGAFSGCSSLSDIGIPSGVTYIGPDAFSGCSSLSDIEIPSSVTEIDNRVFWGCSSLSSIKIPSSETYIGMDVFLGCSDDLVIRGEAGSHAQSYASDYHIKFVVIGSDEDLETSEKINNVTVAKKSYSLTASEKTQTIADLGAKATGGTITYRSNNRSVTVNSQGKVTVAKNFTGTAKITVTAAGAGYQTAAVTVTITVTKAPQSITKAITKKSVKRSAKAQSFKIGARAAGKVTYTVTKKDAKKILTVNREGKVTIKKNAGAGIYTVKVRVTAAAKGIYKKTAKTYTIRVTVKK